MSVLAANDDRRHMTTGARAAARALTLGSERRKDGRWAYGMRNGQESNSSAGFRLAMSQAGQVLDADPDLLMQVAQGYRPSSTISSIRAHSSGATSSCAFTQTS